jgi:hypothetical protein
MEAKMNEVEVIALLKEARPVFEAAGKYGAAYNLSCVWVIQFEMVGV